MANRSYKRLSIEDFGRHLITTGDLDPVYIALTKTFEGRRDQLCRWLLAYFCYYHCGVACYMSDLKDDEFWKAMMIAARNELPSPLGERWPRSAERRHARGSAAIKMITALKARYGDRPEDFVNHLDTISSAGHGGVDFAEISKHVKSHYLMGSWMAFKVGDILECVLGCSISFDNASVFMFKDPRQAAIILWRQKMCLSDNARPRDENLVINEIVEYLKDEFRELKAPPLFNRPIGLQEVETILCCWKSHMRGHYGPYNDINEIRAGLDPRWGPTAADFLAGMPEGGDSWQV